MKIRSVVQLVLLCRRSLLDMCYTYKQTPPYYLIDYSTWPITYTKVCIIYKRYILANQISVWSRGFTRNIFRWWTHYHWKKHKENWYKIRKRINLQKEMFGWWIINFSLIWPGEFMWNIEFSCENLHLFTIHSILTNKRSRETLFRVDHVHSFKADRWMSICIEVKEILIVCFLFTKLIIKTCSRIFFYFPKRIIKIFNVIFVVNE